MVSIGSAANYNQHCDDDPIESTLSGYITTTEKNQSLNKSCSASSETYTSYNPMHDLPRRRIRDTSSRYRRCSSNLKRPANQPMSSKYDYSQHDVSHVHHPAYTQHASDRSSYQQRYSPFQNDHTSSGVYNDKAQKVPYPSLRPESVAQNSAGQLSSSNDNRNNDFESGSQTHNELLQQETIGTMTYQNLDHAQFSFDNEPFQKGIQKFQKRGKDRSDLILVPEGIKKDPFDQRNNDSLGDMNNHGKDSALEPKSRHYALSGSGIIFRIESKGQWQPRQRRQLFSQSANSSDTTRWKKKHENETFFEKSHHQKLATQLQSNMAISENDSSIRLSDINNESNSMGVPHSPSNGISKFKRKRQENTNLKLGHSFQARHIQSDETIFQYRGLSDGFNSLCPDPMCPDENGDQSESPILSIRFFDDQNEIDISGNPLNMPRSSKKELRTNLFGTQRMKSRDHTIGEGRPPIAGLLGSEHFDKLEWQQTSTTSPDTDYLKDTSFGDESKWTFFR